MVPKEGWLGRGNREPKETGRGGEGWSLMIF